MIKITTLFKKDPSDLGRVINEVTEENVWVYDCGVPTRKFDGTSCAIINGELYKRFDAKKTKKGYKKAPIGAIPCQERDEVTGHQPFWVKCTNGESSEKYHWEAFRSDESFEDGTYELCGEKVQRNPEAVEGHKLIKHGGEILNITDFSFESIKKYLSNTELDIEGIVFHNPDGRMCKIRKTDFGIKR